MDPSSPYARPMKRSKTRDSKQFDDGFKGAGNAQSLTKMAEEIKASSKKPPGNVKDDVLNERQMEARYEGNLMLIFLSLAHSNIHSSFFHLYLSRHSFI